MTPRSWSTLLIFGAMLTCSTCAQTTPKATLLALSKQDHTLAIVDPVSLNVMARIPVGDDPHGRGCKGHRQLRSCD